MCFDCVRQSRQLVAHLIVILKVKNYFLKLYLLQIKTSNSIYFQIFKPKHNIRIRKLSKLDAWHNVVVGYIYDKF